jgi:hypothetical protein
MITNICATLIYACAESRQKIDNLFVPLIASLQQRRPIPATSIHVGSRLYQAPFD